MEKIVLNVEVPLEKVLESLNVEIQAMPGLDAPLGRYCQNFLWGVVEMRDADMIKLTIWLKRHNVTLKQLQDALKEVIIQQIKNK